MVDFYDDDEFSEENDSEKNSVNNNSSTKNFLGIMFNCCGVYGRIYKNKEGTAYVGRCPHCLRSIRIPVGKGGTNKRFFNAQ